MRASALIFGVLACSGLAQDRPEILPPDFTKPRDVLRIAPRQCQLDRENERVRVLRLKVNGNEAVPLHDAKDALVICLAKECHLRLSPPAGRAQEVHMQIAETRWINGESRSVANLSSGTLEMLLIEPKP